MLNKIKVWFWTHAESIVKYAVWALAVGVALYGAINTYTDVQAWHRDPQWQSFSDTAGRVVVWGLYLLVWVGYVAPPLVVGIFLLVIAMIIGVIWLQSPEPEDHVATTAPTKED
ncbi:MAG TPA: hypothetical protein PKV96_01880 [Candidatus Saccharimonas sp.]|nr:hypothetical protein [Candidatus Saccharimonas sp.]